MVLKIGVKKSEKGFRNFLLVGLAVLTIINLVSATTIISDTIINTIELNISGDFKVNNTVFFVNSTSGNVGIGTTSPNAKLHVESGNFQVNGSGSSAGLFYNSTSGNLGIGTTGSGQALDVETTSGNAFIKVHSIADQEAGILLYENNNIDWRIFNDGDDGDTLKFSTALSDEIQMSLNEFGFLSLNGGISGSLNVGGYLNAASSQNILLYLDSSDDKVGIQLDDDDTTMYLLAKDSLLSLGAQTDTLSGNLNIDTAGNVGIGTTSPKSNLHVYSGASGLETTYNGINLESNTHQWISFLSPANTQQGLIFNSGGLNDAYITWEDGTRGDYLSLGGAVYIKSGKVGIGTTSPTHKLNVIGAVNITSNLIVGNSSAQSNITLYSPDGTAWTCGVNDSGAFSCS